MLRLSEQTCLGFEREAERRGVTVDVTAAAGLRLLRQQEMGRELAAPLRDDEQAWLEAAPG